MEEFETTRGFRVPKGKGVKKKTSRNTNINGEPLSQPPSPKTSLNHNFGNGGLRRKTNAPFEDTKKGFAKHAFPHLSAEERSYLSPNYSRPTPSQRPLLGKKPQQAKSRASSVNSKNNPKPKKFNQNDNIQRHIERAASVLFEAGKRSRANLRPPAKEAEIMKAEAKEKTEEIGLIFDRNSKEILKYIKRRN